MGTFTNSENPDEMPHSASFHQGLHCKGKTDLQKNAIFFLKIITWHPRICTCCDAMDPPKFIVSSQKAF